MYEMDVFHVIEYIKAAIGVVLDIKFDEIEKRFTEQHHRNQPNKNIQ